MDGLDLSTIDDLLNGSPIESDEDDTANNRSIVTNSPPQTYQATRSKSKTRVVKRKSKSERERELELKILNPNSIRTQILKQSLRDGQMNLELESQEVVNGDIIDLESGSTTTEPTENNDRSARNEDALWSEMETQEKRADEIPNDIMVASQNDCNRAPTDNVCEPAVGSFFRKKMRGSQSEDKGPAPVENIPSPVKSNTNSSQFLSQEEDEEFFDASAAEPQNNEQPALLEEVRDGQPQPHETSPIAPHQRNPEDFQCPYCFKPFGTFPLLEGHVETCYLKIPIDVNKQLYKRSLPSSQEISSYFSRATRLSSQSVKKTKGRRSPKPSSLSSNSPSLRPNHRFTFRPRPSSPNSGRSVRSNSCSSSEPKLSFYQRFIESNSQSLSQSVKADPLQCPYCRHGFLNFSNLESHVVMCTKQKVN